MTYVVKRTPAKYTEGEYAGQYVPDFYYKGTPLGLFNEFTPDIKEAAKYNRKSDATKVAKALGRRFYVEKIA